MSLTYIGQQLTIYIGFSLLATGIIGNGINVLVFSSVRSYRTTPCTFYFLVASISNIIYISWALTSRIAISGYGIDLTRTSIVWCKMRQFVGTTLVLISLSCACLATIDQFFATSQNVSFRRLSNIKWAKRVIFIIIIVWILHGIPILLFYNISSVTRSCIDTDYGYNVYYPIYLLGILCVIPSLTMIIFGYLAYRNIHLTRVLAELQADRQLIRMVLVQIVLVLISYVPFGINNAYGLITSSVTKDTDRLMYENFALTIFSFMTYIYYAESCYMFLISSSRFRRATKDRILLRFRSTQVAPTQMRSIVAMTTEKRTKNSIKPL